VILTVNLGWYSIGLLVPICPYPYVNSAGSV
jgi:hypothetical protein